MRPLAFALQLALVISCQAPVQPAPTDTSILDASASDAVTADTATADTASADTSTFDAATMDARARDATVSDLAISDSATSDSAITDAMWADVAVFDSNQGAGICLFDPPALVGWSAEELKAALANKDFLLINVADSTGAQIPGTDTFISYTDVDGLAAYIGDDLATKVVLYCQSGGRSNVAGNALVARGYCSLHQLTGGRSAWSAAGFAFE